MISELDYQTFTGEFDSHEVPHSYNFVPQKFSKLLFQKNCRVTQKERITEKWFLNFFAPRPPFYFRFYLVDPHKNKNEIYRKYLMETTVNIQWHFARGMCLPILIQIVYSWWYFWQLV